MGGSFDHRRKFCDDHCAFSTSVQHHIKLITARIETFAHKCGLTVCKVLLSLREKMRNVMAGM